MEKEKTLEELEQEAIKYNGIAGVITIVNPENGKVIMTNYAELRKRWYELEEEIIKKNKV